MAENRMTYQQRQEVMHILYWTKTPVERPIQLYKRIAVKCFLDGVDAAKYLQEKHGLSVYLSEKAAALGRVVLGNERGKRRKDADKIRAERLGNKPQFTHENFGVTIDPAQHKDFGMANMSIYALVEVWVDDDEVEKEYLVNFSDFKTKEWLTRLLVWALMNKRQVLLKPATEHEMNNMRMFIPKDRESLD